MIHTILTFCLRERLVVVVASIAVITYGWYSAKTVPLDAIPNVGENQVIVLTEWMGRSPKDIEDQITYPLSIALQAVPGPRVYAARACSASALCRSHSPTAWTSAPFASRGTVDNRLWFAAS